MSALFSTCSIYLQSCNLYKSFIIDKQFHVKIHISLQVIFTLFFFCVTFLSSLSSDVHQLLCMVSKNFTVKAIRENIIILIKCEA